MGTWTEANSALFRVRFDDDDRTEVEELIHVLETVATRLDAHGLRLPPDPTIVIHPTAWSLGLAAPGFVVARSLTETSGRRYLASWTTSHTLHLVIPHRLIRKSGRGQASMREALELGPAAGLAHLALGQTNPALSLKRALRNRQWFWLAWGAGQALVGQVPLLATSIAIRRRERRALTLPPAMRDSVVLGGSVAQLVLRERGLTGLVQMLRNDLPPTPEGWIGHALPGLGPTERDVRWRMLLDELDVSRTAALAEAAAKETEAAEAEAQRKRRLAAEEAALKRAIEETALEQAAARAARREPPPEHGARRRYRGL